jgi:hypothetical protein
VVDHVLEQQVVGQRVALFGEREPDGSSAREAIALAGILLGRTVGALEVPARFVPSPVLVVPIGAFAEPENPPGYGLTLT